VVAIAFWSVMLSGLVGVMALDARIAMVVEPPHGNEGRVRRGSHSHGGTEGAHYQY
jgi:hypothetical protein